MDYVLILAGLALLFVGGEALVRGSVSVARRLNISELVIGLTLVGFGTSAPELFTSLQALSEGAVGIAVGNVLGSNIANALFILGLSALIAPVVVNPASLTRDGAVMIGATILFAALLYFDGFTRVTGLLMLAALIVYVITSLRLDRKNGGAAADLHAAEGEQISSRFGVWTGLGLALVGLVGVVIGARFLVDGASTLAREFGISETLIGLTIVAVGTSLPELATSLIAAIRGRSDIAIGNVIGSNIFNILGILGLSAVYKPFSVMNPEVSAGAMAQAGPVSLFTFTDVGALFTSVFLLMLFAMTGRRIARWEGAVLIGAYVLYIGLLTGAVPVPKILPYG